MIPLTQFLPREYVGIVMNEILKLVLERIQHDTSIETVLGNGIPDLCTKEEITSLLRAMVFAGWIEFGKTTITPGPRHPRHSNPNLQDLRIAAETAKQPHG